MPSLEKDIAGIFCNFNQLEVYIGISLFAQLWIAAEMKYLFLIFTGIVSVEVFSSPFPMVRNNRKAGQPLEVSVKEAVKTTFSPPPRANNGGGAAERDGGRPVSLQRSLNVSPPFGSNVVGNKDQQCNTVRFRKSCNVVR
jgi:hypothetical protein